MRHLTYLAVLATCVVGTLPLEFLLRADAYRRWRRTALAVLPVAALFTVWDLAAIAADWWTFDPDYVIGLDLPGHLPVEEVLFFLVIPVCAILTLEAVRRLRPSWAVDAASTNADPHP